MIFLSNDVHAGAITDGTNSVFDTFWEMLIPAVEDVTAGCDTSTYAKPDNLGEWTHGTWGNDFRLMTPQQPCWGYGKIEVMTDPHRIGLYVKDENGETILHAIVPGE